MQARSAVSRTAAGVPLAVRDFARTSRRKTASGRCRRPAANACIQKHRAGTIDDALERDIGIPTPASDLLLANPYAALIRGGISSGYYGLEYVGARRTTTWRFARTWSTGSCG